jgi:hypothetical protein
MTLVRPILIQLCFDKYFGAGSPKAINAVRAMSQIEKRGGIDGRRWKATNTDGTT